ncbi:MAG: PRC-barrel domain-containing protein [Hyphomicrobiaceae bacterium]
MNKLIPALAAITFAASTSAFAQVSPPVTNQAPAEAIQNQPTTPPADGGMLNKSDSTMSLDKSAQSGAPMLTDEQAQAWINKPVYSSDDRNLGEVAAIKRDSAGYVTEIHADVGGFLGIGETRVRILPDQFKLGTDRVVLNVTGDASKDLPKLQK